MCIFRREYDSQRLCITYTRICSPRSSLYPSFEKNEICTFEYQKKSLVLEYVYMFHISLSSLGRKLVCFWAIQKLISDSKWESYTSILFVKFCFFYCPKYNIVLYIKLYNVLQIFWKLKSASFKIFK
jgi:hypothetical protein